MEKAEALYLFYIKISKKVSSQEQHLYTELLHENMLSTRE